MLIAVLGDLHLGKLSTLLPDGDMDWLQVQLDIIESAIKEAKRRKIKHVIQTGDIYDVCSPDQIIITRFTDLLSKYPEVEFHFILGNHDYYDIETNSLQVSAYLSEIGAHPHVHIYTRTKTVEIEGINFCFVPWPFEKIKKFEHPRIVIAHQDVAGFRRDNGSVIRNGMKTSKKDFFILGHIHKRQEQGNLLYVGTPMQTAMVEEPNKGFYIAEIFEQDEKLVVHKQFLPLKAPYTLHNFKVKSNSDLEKIKPAPNYYRLVLSEGLEIPPDYFMKNTNILNHSDLKSDAIVKSMMEEQSVKVDAKKLLRKFLKHKTRLNKVQIKEGVKIIGDIVSQLKA